MGPVQQGLLQVPDLALWAICSHAMQPILRMTDAARPAFAHADHGNRCMGLTFWQNPTTPLVRGGYPH